MTLATFDLFGAVKACSPAAVGGFDRLRIDNRGARVPRAAFERAQIAAQGVMDAFPGAIASPAPKVMLYDAPRRLVGLSGLHAVRLSQHANPIPTFFDTL